MLGEMRVTDAGVQEIAKHCRDLKTIYLCRTQVTDAGVQEIARNCANLNEINLYGCYQVTYSSIKEIAAHCHSWTQFTG